MKSILIFTTCCLISLLSAAKENSSNITIGVNHTFRSSILNQDRTIQIYTPDGYSDSKQKYPGLYILDGQW